MTAFYKVNSALLQHHKTLTNDQTVHSMRQGVARIKNSLNGCHRIRLRSFWVQVGFFCFSFW